MDMEGPKGLMIRRLSKLDPLESIQPRGKHRDPLG